jgi:5,10-methylenetetrahydrofolate reductase
VVKALHEAPSRGRPQRAESAAATTPAVVHAEPSRAPVARATKSRLAERLARGALAVIADVLPPRGLDTERLLEGVRQLHASGIDLIEVSEPLHGSARMSSTALALLLERSCAIETVTHYSCRDRKLLGMQSDLLGAWALGLRNVVCETGAHFSPLDDPGGTAAFDVDSIGLTNMVRRLNEGVDVGGNTIGTPTAWLVGVNLNPTAVDVDEEVRRFEWKAEAGAEYAVTTPVFDLAALDGMLARVERLRVPVLARVLALPSFENAEFLSNEVPGSFVPDNLLERMRRASERSPEHAHREGIAIARETALALRGRVQGLVVDLSASDPAAATEIVGPLGLARP